MKNQLHERYREASNFVLDMTLKDIRKFNEDKDLSGLAILLPHVREILDSVRGGWNSDLAEIYTPLFQAELPNYQF